MNNATPGTMPLVPPRGAPRDALTTTAVVLAVLGTIADLGLGLAILIDDLSYRQDEWDGFGVFISGFLLVPAAFATVSLIVGVLARRRYPGTMLAPALVACVAVASPWLLLLTFRA